MTGIEIGIAAIAVLLLLVLLGMPIGVAMMASSFGAVAFIRNETVALRMLGSVANDSLEEYLFAIVPLFVLMGLLAGLGHWCLTHAYLQAPASLLTPFTYLQILWATAFGYAIFGFGRRE